MIFSVSRSMLWLAPLIAVAVSGSCVAGGLAMPAAVCAGVATLCALWWMFDCLNIAVVGLVPFVVFPLFGIISHQQIAASYGHTMILLLMGGFFLSAAMERSGAHRRIAVTMVRAVGGRGGRRMVLGFMLATALLSMWISNTATALMMLPIAIAVLGQVEEDSLRVPLLLGIAYSASIGGMATPIGTPPNVIFMSMIDREITFAHWMSYGLPIVALLLPIVWWWLTRSMAESGAIEMPSVGRWRSSEVRVVIIFVVTAMLWIFRASPGGGWSSLIPGADETIGDSTIALAASLCLFLIPAGERLSDLNGGDQNGGDQNGGDQNGGDQNGSDQNGGDQNGGTRPHADSRANVRSGGDVDHETEPQRPRESNFSAAPATPTAPATPPPTERLLDWPTAANIPWGILLMFGGGLALAAGFETSGLSRVLGAKLTVFSAAPEWAIVLSICLMVTFLTELTSSTATATLLLPILSELAAATGLDPITVMIPATISCSCAFMLPIATPPNAIVYGAGGIRNDEMARTGFVLNLIAAGVITGVTLAVSHL